MPHRIETVNVGASPMEVFLFAPEGKGPHPGLVLCQHIPGGHTGLENDPVTLATAERYREGPSEDAWKKALAFFAEHLKQGS